MMGLVRLYFPVDVTIQPIDKTATKYNGPAREPVLQVARAVAPILISAQVQWIRRNAPVMTKAGLVLKTNGYLVVLTEDLEALSYTPSFGDRITDIPDEPGTYFVTELRPGAHKGGKNQIMNLYFEDRNPLSR
jgi:hypothetical protein